MDKDQKQRGRLIQREIGAVLLRHWDPIGVRDDPEASDEYNAYIGGVYRLLASGASPKEIATHLCEVEAERLGFEDTEPQMLIPLANKLKKVYARFERPGSV